MAPSLAHRIKYWLRRTACSRWYGPVAGGLCFLATLSMSVPATGVLIPAVILAARRWKQIFIWCALGSGLGGGVIAAAFHAWDWNQVYRQYPEFAQSQAWLQVLDWMKTYGLYALAAIAALPLPQTPALIFCGITQVSLPGIALAVMVGKLAKYGVVAWMVATFPERFLHYLHRDEKKKG